MKAVVTITLKKSVLDPQGKTILSALGSLGFGGVEAVRCGKMIELSAKPGVNAKDFERDLKNMCEKLLANTVIEEYKWEMVS